MKSTGYMQTAKRYIFRSNYRYCYSCYNKLITCFISYHIYSTSWWNLTYSFETVLIWQNLLKKIYLVQVPCKQLPHTAFSQFVPQYPGRLVEGSILQLKEKSREKLVKYNFCLYLHNDLYTKVPYLAARLFFTVDIFFPIHGAKYARIWFSLTRIFETPYTKSK